MANYLEPLDCVGKKIAIGDEVLIVMVSDHLLSDLPTEEQEVVKAQAGKTVRIRGFDDYGYAEIEFEYETVSLETIFHTIWVEPSCLRKVTGA